MSEVIKSTLKRKLFNIDQEKLLLVYYKIRFLNIKMYETPRGFFFSDEHIHPDTMMEIYKIVMGGGVEIFPLTNNS